MEKLLSQCLASSSGAHVWSYAQEIKIKTNTYSKVTCLNCKKVDLVLIS